MTSWKLFDHALAAVLLLFAVYYAGRLIDGQVVTTLPGEGGLLPQRVVGRAQTWRRGGARAALAEAKASIAKCLKALCRPLAAERR